MPLKSTLDLHCLDRCLADAGQLRELIAVLQRIEKCCAGVEHRHNLADIVHDPANRDVLLAAFQGGSAPVGIQLLAKVALSGYSSRSLTLRKPISGRKKVDFCYRTLGAWTQFESVLALQFPDPEHLPVLLNPKRPAHWQQLAEIPVDSLCTLYLKDRNPKRQLSQEAIALDRFEALMTMLEEQDEPAKLEPAPVVELRARAAKTEKAHAAAPAKASPAAQKGASRFWGATGESLGAPSATLKVVINKIDTFLHAGNAQLITSHITSYAGRVRFYVLRGEKKLVSLDPDSIWSAEIRNGESVLFEFFGSRPSNDFLKELAKKVNKYCQMDKVMEG